MFQGRHCLRLAGELAGSVLRPPRRVDHLDRDGAIEGAVARTEDRAHAALADELEDFITIARELWLRGQRTEAGQRFVGERIHGAFVPRSARSSARKSASSRVSSRS